MPRVSVIIPAYNYARFLPQAIDSALAQTYADREIIVVDDGSTDETPDVARRYDGRIRYHRQANRGLSGARNTGARLAQGQLLAFLDADDLWDAQKLARQTDILQHEPAVGLVSHLMRFIDVPGNVTPGQKPGVAPGETLTELIERGTAAPSSFLARRTCYEEVGGFDEQLTAMEDLDFCLRLAGRDRRDRAGLLPGPLPARHPAGGPAKVAAAGA